MNRGNFSYIRLYCSGLVLLLMFAGVIARHVYLAIDHQEFLLDKSQARTQRVMSLAAPKGVMEDRRGRPVALSVSHYQLALLPKQIAANDPKIDDIAVVLDMPVGDLKELLDKKSDKNYVLVRKRLTQDQVKKATRVAMKGVVIEEKKGRYYPEGKALAPLIGFVGADGDGLAGVEYQFGDYIDGEGGSISYTQNLLGQITAIHDARAIQPGQNLRLSIDRRLQWFAYQILEEGVEYYDATNAVAVVLDVSTGEILAMANYPSFDPNQPIQALDERTKNHAVSDLFEPGSIIKPIALSAMLQHAPHRADEMIDTEQGEWETHGISVHDHRNLGNIHFEDILAKSSNIAMAKLSLKLPKDALIQQYRAFGLFDPSFAQIPGEAIGRHRPKVTPVDVMSMSYGYGISTTALGMARAYNIIANKGLDAGVHLVFEKHRPQPNVVIQPEVAEQITQMMLRVTQFGGVSKRAGIKGIQVAGKSGTTHRLDERGQYHNHYVASFAGFAPADDPQVVGVVIVTDPKRNGHYGGAVAGPMFAKLMNFALHYH